MVGVAAAADLRLQRPWVDLHVRKLAPIVFVSSALEQVLPEW